VEDCGRIINPMIVDGQVHGAAQGIGAALLKKIVYDERGQLLTASLADYLLPSAPEIPRWRSAISKRNRRPRLEDSVEWARRHDRRARCDSECDFGRALGSKN
jgi:CO/xanthine dehydrogenase Mo-binding subunit